MLETHLDDETVVDLQAEDINNEDESIQPLISSSSSRFNLKRLVAATVLILCICGIILVAVWELCKTFSVPVPTPTIPPGPAPIPTIQPLPKNASDLSAEELLYLMFDRNTLDYIEIKCLPQSPPTFKFMLMIKSFSNFTGASNTKEHAMEAVSREACENMFGLDYDRQYPIPPPPQACQFMCKFPSFLADESLNVERE